MKLCGATDETSVPALVRVRRVHPGMAAPRWLWFFCSLVLIFPLATRSESADNEKPKPGSVRLQNGLILRGMCSAESSFVDDEAADQRLELRLIDQGFRRIYVSTRRSEPPVENPGDWPALDFPIAQRRSGSRRSVPGIIGIPKFSGFDPQGRGTVTLRLPQGREEVIQVGITQINELYAEVQGLSHDWKYSVALKSLPANIIYPGLLERVTGFDKDPFRRLDIARMLIRAGLLVQAGQLLQSIATEFPETRSQIPASQEQLQGELGRQILEELELRHGSGQYDLAVTYGRGFPEQGLPADILVRCRQLLDSVDQQLRRCEAIRARVPVIQATLRDPEQVRTASAMLPVVLSEVHPHTIDDFAAFELLASDDRIPPENAIALAVSGWLLGAGEAIQSPAETYGLFEARQLVLDYLGSDDDEDLLRNDVLSRLAGLEGVSVDRVASLISRLPAVNPIPSHVTGPPEAPVAGQRRFRIESTAEMMGCVGLLPPEYRDSRSYPLVIAFSRELLSGKSSIQWWQHQAARHGYIVVVPAAWEEKTGVYAASAEQHRAFLALVRHLKLGLRVDDDRVFVAGHGIGGEAAMDMATSHPELFAGVISIAGLGRKHLQWTAHNEPDLPWYIVVGGSQGAWSDRLGLLISKLFRRSTAESRVISDVMFIKYPERGFEMFFEESPHVFEWMRLHSRKRYSEQLDVQLLRSTDLRWSWLELDDLPLKSAVLDAPSTNTDGDFRAALLEARITRGNAIFVSRSPSAATLKLSPELPGIDLQKPVTVILGRERRAINFAPSLRDLLEEVRRSGERKRLCYMKVTADTR